MHRRDRSHRRAHRAALFTLLGLTALGCAKQALKVDAPDTIYGDAVMKHADEEYDFAVQRYRELLDHYPLDHRAQEIELRVAHAHLADGSHAQAVAAFSDFQRMHPTSPHLPEVEYRIGQSYVAQIDSIDRDLAAARQAHKKLRSVVARYPTSEFAKGARQELHAVREHLAGRELYIAEYYFDRDQYSAGWTRSATVLKIFPETETAADAARVLSSAALARGDGTTSTLAIAAASEIEARQNALAESKSLRFTPGPALRALRTHLETPPDEPEPTA